MRQIPLSYGMLYFLDELEFSEAALAADEDAAGLAAPFAEAIGEWEGLFAQERATRRDVIRAEAVVAVRNERLDSLTKRFAAAVRAFVPESSRSSSAARPRGNSCARGSACNVRRRAT